MPRKHKTMKKLIVQIIKFGIVGVIATVIDFGVLAFMKEVLDVNVQISTAVSFSVSVFANYLLSMLFVFKSKEDNKIKEFIEFLLLSIGGLLLDQLVMWLGTDVFTVYYLAVKVFATVVVAIYNFVTRKIFLEKKPAEEK